MPFTYPKNEKLKSKKTIELLFSEGQSVSKYPLRLVYVDNSFENEELINSLNERLGNLVLSMFEYFAQSKGCS